MRKTQIHIEVVPVAVARKVLERQIALAKRNGKGIATGKKAVKKQGRARK